MINHNKQKLELTWIGKNNPEYNISNIEPRILEERIDLSYGENNTENIIIHGDNLLALKALLPEYEGRIKCIYIDPPYNTGSAFEHYDDSVEHSTWLSLMKPRLELLRMLLSDEGGSIWVSLDDNEGHYFKVLMDEVFGRTNFIGTVIWQKVFSLKNSARHFSVDHDYILVFAKNAATWVPNPMKRTEKQNANYKNPDNDPRGPWQSVDLSARNFYSKGKYPITSPTGRTIDGPPTGRYWSLSQENFIRLQSEGRIWWGKDGNGNPRHKLYLSEVSSSRVPQTFWPYEEVGHTQDAKKESIILFGSDVFGTPKPEALIERIVHIATQPGDLILDSFLGSGTTTAVAHKMKRKYIGIEMGHHAYTHVQTRMKKVVEGKDGLKLSKDLGWKGGGGFKFYELAPSFVAIDEFGNPVIDNYYNDTKLIRAMCKLTNYTFAPSPSEYWKHGKGQGKNNIYITTQMLSVAMVQQIVRHLAPEETLLICPKKFEPGCEKVDGRITIKKIPQSILKSCQFGKKEYLLPLKEQSIEEFEEEELINDQE